MDRSTCWSPGQGMLAATVAALLVATAACGSGTGETGVVRRDSAGVNIVSNHAPDRAISWRFERLWSIGGREDARLATPELNRWDVAADAAGRVYVLDEAGGRVLVLNAEGALVDTLGGPGAGPGELETPIAIAVARDGTVGVFDYGKGGIVRWVDGEPVGLLRISERYWGPDLALTERGAIFVRLTGSGTSEQRLVAWREGAGHVRASFSHLPSHSADFSICGFRDIPVAPLFAPELVWDARGAAIVVSTGPEYRIDRLENGRRVASIRRAVEPRAVTESMALRQVGDGFYIAVADCTVPPAEVVRGRGYADVLPAIVALVLAPDGRIWAARGRVADEPAIVDLFAPDGAYLGMLPPGSPFPAAFPGGADRIVSVERGPLDVPRVTVFAVDATGGGGADARGSRSGDPRS